MTVTRKINDYERCCLNLFEDRLHDCLCSFELIKSENIFDEDTDTVFRSFTFNRGIEEHIFVIAPNKEIKYFEYGVPETLVEEIKDAIF